MIKKDSKYKSEKKLGSNTNQLNSRTKFLKNKNVFMGKITLHLKM